MHTPHDRSLIRGDGDALLHHFEACFPQAREVWITVAFVMDAGVDLIRPFLEDLLEREGTRLRLLTGDYFEVSEPRGLERLLDLALHYNREEEPDRVELRVFETRGGGGSLAFVGSSNLSRSALGMHRARQAPASTPGRGIEWNYRIIAGRGVDQPPYNLSFPPRSSHRVHPTFVQSCGARTGCDWTDPSDRETCRDLLECRR